MEEGISDLKDRSLEMIQLERTKIFRKWRNSESYQILSEKQIQDELYLKEKREGRG